MSGHIAVIGAGDLGITMGKLLGQDSQVKFWDRNQKQGVLIEEKIENALTGANVVLLCVPTLANQELTKEYKKYINPKAIVVTFSKGLTAKGLTVPELLKKELGRKQPIVYVGGPMLFAEIGEGKLWWPMVCGEDKKIRLQIAKLFSDVTVRQAENPAIGAIAGVAKNCYALAAGVAAAAGWGSNTLGRLLSQGVAEMNIIVNGSAKVKDRSVIMEIALSDLMATSLSPWSKNRSAGQAIFNGQAKVVSEGVVSIAPFVKRLGVSKMKKLPLLAAINKIVNQKGDVNLLLSALK